MPEKDIPKNEGKDGELDIISQANAVVDAYLKKRQSLAETLLQAEEIVSNEIFQKKIKEFGALNVEFMKDYAQNIKKLGTLFAVPLVEELDRADVQRDTGEITAKELHVIYRDARFKTIETAVSLAIESPSLGVPGDQGVFDYDPLEISSVFVYIMGKRFGDKDNLAPVGWITFLDGLVGTDISLEEEITSTKSHIGRITGQNK